MRRNVSVDNVALLYLVTVMMASGVATTLTSLRTPVVMIRRENPNMTIMIIQRERMNMITQIENIIMIIQRAGSFKEKRSSS